MPIENISVLSWILIGILLLMGGVAYARVKKGKDKIVGFGRNKVIGVFVVSAVTLFVVQAGFLGGMGLNPLAIGDTGVQTVIETGEPVLDTNIGLCAVEDTTITFSAIDRFTQSSAGGSHRYRINSNPALTVSDAGTITASPADVISVLWENASTTSNYYSDVDKFVVPCKGTYTASTELSQNGTVTISVFNEERNLISGSVTGTENETLANGDVVTLSAEMVGSFQRAHPYGGVMVAEYDQATYDDVIIKFGGVKTDTPTFYSITNSGNTTKTYTIPSIVGSTGAEGKLEGSIIIDADDTINPHFGNDILLTFYPNNYYIDEDLGGAFAGSAVEDEDDAQTTAHTTKYRLNVD